MLICRRGAQLQTAPWRHTLLAEMLFPEVRGSGDWEFREAENECHRLARFFARMGRLPLRQPLRRATRRRPSRGDYGQSAQKPEHPCPPRLFHVETTRPVRASPGPARPAGVTAAAALSPANRSPRERMVSRPVLTLPAMTPAADEVALTEMDRRSPIEPPPDSVRLPGLPRFVVPPRRA